MMTHLRNVELAPSPATLSSSPHPAGPRAVNLTQRNHATLHLSRHYLGVLRRSRVRPQRGAAPKRRPAIQAPWIPCTPNQPQYEFSHWFFDRTLTCSIPFSQFSNCLMSLSFISSLASPQTHGSSATMHDSASSIRGGPAMTSTTEGCAFYDR